MYSITPSLITKSYTVETNSIFNSLFSIFFNPDIEILRKLPLPLKLNTVQAKDIEQNFAIQQAKQEQYRLTKMKFKDGRMMFGHFLMADQSQSLKAQNKWVFYFDEIRLIIHGDDIVAFNNIYSRVDTVPAYA